MNNKKDTALLSDAITLRLKLCLLNLINDLTLPENQSPPTESLGEIEKELVGLLPSFSEALRSPDSDRSSLNTALTELKKRTIKEASPIFSLMNFLCTAQDIIAWEQGGRLFMKKPFDNNIDDSFIIESFHDLIHEAEPDMEGVLLSEIMSALPCRMSKGVFSDYVMASFGSYEENADDAIWLVRSKTLPFADKKAGEMFPEYVERFHSLINDAAKMTDKEIEDADEELSVCAESIFALSDYASMIFNDINYMFALSSFGYDLDFVSEENMIIKDIFYSAIELKSKKNPDEIDEELRAKTNEKSEEIIDSLYDSLEGVNDKFIKRYDHIVQKSQQDSDLEKYLKAYITLTVLYNIEIETAIINAEKKDKTLTAEDYLSEFEKLTADMPPYTKKQFRRMFMRFADCPYDAHRVLDYVADSLSYYDGKKEKNFVLGMACEVLYDFSPHDHDHDDCDCHDHDHGHDHSHGHMHL